MGVIEPSQMNEAFARAFNSRNIENLLALYEPGAVVKVDESEKTSIGLAAIAAALEHLLRAPGIMTSKNNFCIEHDGLALLRADWELVADGAAVASGSSVELVRRQPGGCWLYVIDHAVGAGLPRIA